METILKFSAVEVYGLMSRNFAIKRIKPQLIQTETEHLSYEEVKSLLSHVRRKPYGLAVWIALMTGMRVGEIQYLRWEHVDFDMGYISVEGTYCRKTNVMQNHPKGKRQFDVKIPRELFDYLVEEQQLSKSKYVVTSIRSGDFMSYDGYLRVLKRYCREISINAKIGTHGLRHSTHEIYMQHGATDLDMKDLFAHSSVKTTERYIHRKHRKRKNIEAVAHRIQMF